MGNLSLDASSPSSVWNPSGDASTGSFTPPANSLLVVWLRYNTGTGNTPTDPTVTDSLGVPLAYTLRAHNRNPEVSTAVDGALAVWSAPVFTSAAMTVTAHDTDAATGDAILVQVFTDDSGNIPGIGAIVENASASAITSVAEGFTATVTGSRGLIALSDFNAAGVPAAGSGCTVTGGDAFDQGATLAYCCALRSTADGVAGATTTMNLTISSTTDARWITVEVTPAQPPQVGNAPAQFWPGAGPFQLERLRPDPYADVISGVTESAATIDPALATWSAVAVSPVPGVVSTTITPATATWAAVAVVPVPQPVALSLTVATSTWTAVPVVATPSVSITPATAVWTSVAVSPVPQPVAVTITPATATWSAVTVSPVPQPVTVSLTPAVASWAAVTVSPVPGATAVTLTAATATWAAVVVAPQASGTVTLTPATAAWAAIAVALTPGQTARTITPATAAWSAIAVSALPTTAISPALSTWAAVALATTPGQVALTLSPAAASWSAIALGIPAGPSAVTLTPAGSTWNAIPMGISGAGVPGYIAGVSSAAGPTGGVATAAGQVAGAVAASGGASATTSARIDGNAAAAGKVDGHVF